MATACSFINSPHRKLLAWALGYALFRLLSSPFTPVPFTVPLDPIAVCAAGMVSLGERKRLPEALVLALAGMVAGDLAAGLSAAALLPRALGLLLLMLVLPRKTDPLTAASFFIATHAVWSALGPEFRGEYPFAYLYTVSALQGLLFLGLLLPLLPNEPFRPSPFLTANLLLIPLAVLGLSLLLQPLPLWPPPHLGQAGSTPLRILATLLILPPFLPALLRFLQSRRRPKRPESLHPGPHLLS